MDGEVNSSVEKRLVDLFRKQPLAAGLGERAVDDPVAGRADRHDGALPAVDGGEALFDLFRLNQGKRASSGPDPQRG